MIGRAGSDSTVRAIYVHFDGSPETMLPRLARHLDAAEKIDRVLGWGDLRSLAIQTPKRVVARRIVDSTPILVRDPFETPQSARSFENMAAFLRGAYNEAAAYAYLWIDGVWIAFSEESGIWKTLAPSPTQEAQSG